MKKLVLANMLILLLSLIHQQSLSWILQDSFLASQSKGPLKDNNGAQHAKAYLAALNDNIKKFESKHGEIKMPTKGEGFSLIWSKAS